MNWSNNPNQLSSGGVASREYAEKLNTQKAYEQQRQFSDTESVAPVPLSPIAQGVTRARNCTEQIQTMVSELERKIGPILRPELAGKGDGQTGNPRPMQSDLATGLSSHTESLDLIIAHLGNLIDRVEL